MDGYEDISKEDFLKLPTEDIREIVEKEGRPRVVTYQVDGGQKMNIYHYGLDPESDNYWRDQALSQSRMIRENMTVLFGHGVKTIYAPILKIENWGRGKKYVSDAIEGGVKSILTSPEWLEFYEKYDVKVKIYGNMKFLEESELSHLLELYKEIESKTSNHKSRKVFYGVPCGNRHDLPNVVHDAIDFYRSNGREPTYDELTHLYYGDDTEDVDIFLRSTTVRDSDIMPLFVSGKIQMYFLVAPMFLSLTSQTYREILYDYLFCRTIGSSSRVHKGRTYLENDLELIKEYYEKNRYKIFGIGRNYSGFWLPYLDLEDPMAIDSKDLNG